MAVIEVLVTEDGEIECSAPKLWRYYFSKIVGYFLKKYYVLSFCATGVAPISNEEVSHMKNYIEVYGEDLIHFPCEAGDSSMCRLK